MISRGTWSFLTDRPLVVSFEVTHSCTADCLHCDKGGIKRKPAGLLRAPDYARLRAQLNAETRNATVVIVAQRVSTILNADRILVLDDGAVVGSGTHEQLMVSCDEYREIVVSQLGENAA